MAEEKKTLLVVDSSDEFVDDFKMITKGYFNVLAARTEQEAIELINRRKVDVVFMDLLLANNESGIDVLGRLKESFPDLPVIIMTAYATVESAVEAMRLGASHYISKSPKIEELQALVEKTLEERTLKLHYEILREEIQRTSGRIVGKSAAVREIFESIQRVAMTDVTVLITGESGTGKELVAREIHYASKRRQEAFVVVNCASLVRDLIESELFGHVKGAFTGASQTKRGKFEIADGGTIFLDEVAELDHHAQVKLLRVLQEREIDRVGGSNPIPVDVRVIAATNRDLVDMTQQGQFREDLFYRLNVYPINLPPLREHKDDIPLLVESFLQRYGTALGKPNHKVGVQALDNLANYDWPGNVRELENIVQRAMLLAGSGTIRPEHLPKEISETGGADFVPRSLREIERNARDKAARNAIVQALESSGWNVRESAKTLGIPEKTLYDRCSRLGIKLSKRISE